VGPPQGDFANYFTAASLWWEGADLSRLYDFRFFNDQVARSGFGDRLAAFTVLTPPMALVAAPLVPLGAVGAAKAWWVGQCAMGWFLGIVTARSLDRPAWMGVAGLVLIGPALRSHLFQGQFHLPAVLALSGGFWAWRTNRDRLAGVFWGLAVGLKIHAWPLLVAMAIARKWRVAGWGLLTIIVGGGISICLLGWPLHAVWIREVLPASGGGWFADPWHPAFQSIRHLLRGAFMVHPGLNPNPSWSVPWLAPTLGVAQHTLVIGLTCMAAVAWRCKGALERQRIVSAAALAALASGPLLASYHLVLILPPLAWAADALWRNGHRIKPLAAIALAILAGSAPFPTAWPDGWLIVFAVPRAWCLLSLWLLLLPWPRELPTLRVCTGLMLCAGLGGSLGYASFTRTQGALHADGAQAIDGPGFPLIAADLMRTQDGSLWFAGIRGDREGWAGNGWMGFRLKTGETSPEIVVSDTNRHVWSPQATGIDTAEWTTGPNGGPDAGRRVPCLDGELGTMAAAGEQHIAWFDADGTARQITQTSGHHAYPVCDAANGDAIFLSDRGVGVRALRLWRIPLDAG